MPLDQLAVDQHHAEDVVEGVRHLAQVHRRRRRGSRLVPGPGGGVPDRQGHPVAGTLVGHGPEADLRREVRAVAATRGQPDVDAGRPGSRVHQAVGDEDVDPAADQLLRRPAEQALGLRVDVLDPTTGADLDDGVGDRREDLAPLVVRLLHQPPVVRRATSGVSRRARPVQSYHTGGDGRVDRRNRDRRCATPVGRTVGGTPRPCDAGHARGRAHGEGDMALPEPPVASSAAAVDGFDVRLAALLDAAPDALVCVEPSGRIAQVNQQVGQLFGYDDDELLGAEVEILLPEALRGRHVAHRAGFNAHPQVRSMGSGLPLVARRRDGSQFPVEVSLAPWAAGEEGWVIAAIRDVTEQRALVAASAGERGAPAPDRRERRPRLPPAPARPAGVPVRQPGSQAAHRHRHRLGGRSRPDPRDGAGAPRRPRPGGGGVHGRVAGGPAGRLRAPAAHRGRRGALGACRRHPGAGAERPAGAHRHHHRGHHRPRPRRRGPAARRGGRSRGQRLEEPVPLPDEPRAAHAPERRAGLRPAAEPPAGGHRARRGGRLRAQGRPAPARPDQRRARHLADRVRRAVAEHGDHEPGGPRRRDAAADAAAGDGLRGDPAARRR